MMQSTYSSPRATVTMAAVRSLATMPRLRHVKFEGLVDSDIFAEFANLHGLAQLTQMRLLLSVQPPRALHLGALSTLSALRFLQLRMQGAGAYADLMGTVLVSAASLMNLTALTISASQPWSENAIVRRSPAFPCSLSLVAEAWRRLAVHRKLAN
jgi:hypothetical protein